MQYRMDRVGRHGRMPAKLLVIVLALLAGCAQPPSEISSLGTLEVDRIELTADSVEPIVEVMVTEGDRVTVGTPLIRQDPARVNNMMLRARADLATARARLAEAEAGPRAQDIAAARSRLAAATSDARTAKIELDRERSLVVQNYSSKNNVDILAGRYQTALARQQEAEAKLAELEEGTRSETIDAARSQYALAEAQVADIALSLSRLTVTAPLDGLVESVIYELGERPLPGAVVLVLVRDQMPYARIHIPAPVRTLLTPGAEAAVSVDGHAAPYAGRLRWVAHDASFTPYFALTQHDRSHLSYLAEVELTDPAAAKLLTGIPVQVTFPGVQ
ncbi:MAG: HlyD family secretion protein [Pseudomonadota bacterium]